MLGFAMGAIGMSLFDFKRMTPDDFIEACKAHSRAIGNAERSQWERARMIAAVTVQPHCKKKIDPQKLLPFPWDKKKAQPKTEQKASREEIRARYKKLLGESQP